MVRPTAPLSDPQEQTESYPNVILNVGGTRFEVARRTIDRYPESMLATLISKKWSAKDSSKAIYIDRDGPRFQFVLDFLRDGVVHLPSSTSKEALRTELAYYGLPEDADIKEGGLGLSRIAGVMKKLKTKLEEYKEKVTATSALIEALSDATSRHTNRGRAKRTWNTVRAGYANSCSRASEAIKRRAIEVAEELDLGVTADVDKGDGSILCTFE